MPARKSGPTLSADNSNDDSRCLNRPSPLERIYRDLSFYVRHDNDDHILATIGKEALGQAHDPSFYKP